MSNRRVLVLEEDVAIATMLVDVLRYEGYEPAVAYTPEHGRRLAGSFHPDIVLIGCDGRGAFVPGWEAASLLSAQLPGVPLVMLSTSDAAVAEVGITGRGRLFHGAMLKPFMIEALVRLLVRLCPPSRRSGPIALPPSHLIPTGTLFAPARFQIAPRLRRGCPECQTMRPSAGDTT